MIKSKINYEKSNDQEKLIDDVKNSEDEHKIEDDEPEFYDLVMLIDVLLSNMERPNENFEKSDQKNTEISTIESINKKTFIELYIRKTGFDYDVNFDEFLPSKNL